MAFFPKLSTSKLFLIAFLFFATLVVLTSATCRYVPFSKPNNYAKYEEGMTLSPEPLVPEPAAEAYNVPGFNSLFMSAGGSKLIDPKASVDASKAKAPAGDASKK
jgi:hypothetical protein